MSEASTSPVSIQAREYVARPCQSPNEPVAGEPPRVISLQPKPISYVSVRERHPNGTWSTSIARLFRPQDVPHCRLCDRCIANPSTGLCLLVVPDRISPDDAAMHSLAGQTVSVQRN